MFAAFAQFPRAILIIAAHGRFDVAHRVGQQLGGGGNFRKAAEIAPGCRAFPLQAAAAAIFVHVVGIY